jgi:uncharacterized membrane protein YeiB
VARPLAEKLTGREFRLSGSYVDTLHDAGLVLAVTVAVVLLATSSGALRTVSDRVFAPLKVWGRHALSLYLLHVGLIAWWVATHERVLPSHFDPLGWAMVVILPLVLSWCWDRWVGTGPVEWLMGRVTLRPKPLRPTASRKSPQGNAPAEPVR